MERKMRTFKQLEKEKSLKELNQFAKEVTEMCATEQDRSQKNIAKDNHLTPKGIRDLMDYAIVTALVSLETAIQVKEKSVRNQQRKSYDAGESSIRHHNTLMKKREQYLLGRISNAETKKIAEDVAYNSSKSIRYFTIKYQLETDRITKLILKKAIIENIISDEVMELIIKRSLGNNPSEKAEEVFQQFRNQRNEYKSSY